MNFINLTRDFIRIFLWKHTWSFLRLKFYLNLVSGSNVLNLHESDMINVHASNNNVIAISHRSHNNKVILIVSKLNVLGSKCLKLQLVSFETLLHCCVHPKLILIRKCVCSCYWRVMRDLFWDVFPSFAPHFKGLAKDRVEWFCHSWLCTSVLRNWECGHISHS